MCGNTNEYETKNVNPKTFGHILMSIAISTPSRIRMCFALIIPQYYSFLHMCFIIPTSKTIKKFKKMSRNNCWKKKTMKKKHSLKEFCFKNSLFYMVPMLHDDNVMVTVLRRPTHWTFYPNTFTTFFTGRWWRTLIKILREFNQLS